MKEEEKQEDIAIDLGDIKQYPVVDMYDDTDSTIKVRVLFSFDNDLNKSEYSFCVLSKVDNPNIPEVENEDIIFCVKHRDDGQEETIDLSVDNEETQMVKQAFVDWNVQKNS